MCGERGGGGTYDTYIHRDSLRFIGFKKDISKRSYIIHPLNKTTFFVQGSNHVCPDVFYGISQW